MANESSLLIKEIKTEINCKSHKNRHYYNVKRNSDNKNYDPLKLSFASKNNKSNFNKSNDKEAGVSEDSKVRVTTNNNSSFGNTKMGSRRIFTPQFKIQVLESYRNDTDCKGNQRATARKYNIHRRQIQKWLQCESNLRSSVANNNQNNIKHQFHNISHTQHHQQQREQTQVVATPIIQTNITSSGSGTKKCSEQCSLFPQQYCNTRILSLGATRHSVALIEPSAQEGLERRKLEAFVSTPTATGGNRMVDVSTLSTSKLLSTETNTVPISPLTVLRSTTFGTSSSASHCSITAPSMLHREHQRNMHQMLYTHTPSVLLNSVAVPVPMHHQHNHHELSPYHLEVGTNLKNHYGSHQYHHQHHLSHLLTPPQQSSVCSFMPSSSLPELPAFPSTAHSVETAIPIKPVSVPVAVIGEKQIARSNELRDSLAGSDYIHNDGYASSPHSSIFNSAEERDSRNTQQYCNGDTVQECDKISQVCVSPIDLSIARQQREEGDLRQIHTLRANSSTSWPLKKISTNVKNNSGESNKKLLLPTEREIDNSVVDLTCRKRKATVKNHSFLESDIPQEKINKSFDEEHNNGRLFNVSKAISEEDIEVDVEKMHPIKPVKLFKPYLLGENEKQNCSEKKNDNIQKNDNDLSDSVISSHHSNCDYSRSNHENVHEESNRYFCKSTSADISPFPVGSYTFRASNSKSSANVLRCPKGSPVSGYESSSSTYSDSSFGSDHYIENTYNINLRMQPIDVTCDYYNDNVIYGNNNNNNNTMCSSYSQYQGWEDLNNAIKMGAQRSIPLYA